MSDSDSGLLHSHFVEKNWFGHWGTLSSLRPLMAWHIVCVDSSITRAVWATPHLMAVREASAAQWLLFEARDSTPFMVLLCPSLSNNKQTKRKQWHLFVRLVQFGFSLSLETQSLAATTSTRQQHSKKTTKKKKQSHCYLSGFVLFNVS